jgi:hypothetical protein
VLLFRELLQGRRLSGRTMLTDHGLRNLVVWKWHARKLIDQRADRPVLGSTKPEKLPVRSPCAGRTCRAARVVGVI